MPGHALIDALPDFGVALRTPQPRAQGARVPELVPQPPPAPEPEPERFTREQLEKAASDARAETEARLAALHEIEKAALEADRLEEIERLTREMGEKAGAVVAERFAALEANLSAATGAVVARILGVALSEEVTNRAVAQLADALRAALADRETVRVRIRGPLSLFEALRPALGQHADRAEFTEAAGPDISVDVDASLFETRISEWSSALSEALAGARA